MTESAGHQRSTGHSGGILATLSWAALGISYLLSALALIGIIVLVLAQVYYRYVLGSPLVWSAEISRLALALITFWGLAWVDSRGSHLAIEFSLPDSVPNIITELLYLARSIITGAVALTVAYAAFDYATGLQLSAPATGLPLNLHFFLISIGLLAWAVHRFAVTLGIIIGMRRGESFS